MSGVDRVQRRLALLALTAVGAVGVVACSLPPDERPTRIDANDLGPELVNPTTTTTTTVPPTTTPPTTDPDASAPTTTTTTTLPLQLEQQRIYYSIGASEVLQALSLPLPDRASYATIREELQVPRPEVRGLGLASAVRPGLIEAFRFDAETVTLTIELDADVFGELTESQRRRAIGQIVLTYTSFAPPDSGAVGFVVFAIEGEPISVPVPRTGSASEEGQPLRFADFETLLDDDAPPPTDPPTTPPTTPPGAAATTPPESPEASTSVAP
jgi:hypothetical protein